MCIRDSDYLDEVEAENGNRAMDDVCSVSVRMGCVSFVWDCDGLGATLRDNVSKGFANLDVHLNPYKGSQGPHDPDLIFMDATSHQFKDAHNVRNKNVFRNKKAQNITGFADRVRKTAQAVRDSEEGKAVFVDRDELVSFCRESINETMLRKLKAESCKQPKKRSSVGMIEYYSKAEFKSGIPMKDGSKLKLPSPGLFDAVVMLFDKNTPPSPKNTVNYHLSLIHISEPTRPY